jgi:hypothetical protein
MVVADDDRWYCPKSAIAILPRRLFRASGKPAQTACNPARRDGKSSPPQPPRLRLAFAARYRRAALQVARQAAAKRSSFFAPIEALATFTIPPELLHTQKIE